MCLIYMYGVYSYFDNDFNRNLMKQLKAIIIAINKIIIELIKHTFTPFSLLSTSYL